MKRITALLLLCLCIILSVTSCSGGKDDTTSEEVKTVATEPAETEDPEKDAVWSEDTVLEVK